MIKEVQMIHVIKLQGYLSNELMEYSYINYIIKKRKSKLQNI